MHPVLEGMYLENWNYDPSWGHIGTREMEEWDSEEEVARKNKDRKRKRGGG